MITNGPLDGDVGGVTSLIGGALGSRSGEMDFATMELMLEDLIERERSTSVSFNASFDTSGKGFGSSSDSGGSQYGVTGIGGSYSSAALDGTTAATLGQGNVTIGNQTQAETHALLGDAAGRMIKNADLPAGFTRAADGRSIIDAAGNEYLSSGLISDNGQIILKDANGNTLRLNVNGGDAARAGDDVYTGGPHRETSNPVGDGLDSHHCPARDCYKNAPISSVDGPAVQMDPADHRLTSSYGSGHRAQSYRAEQQRLVDEGRVQEAIQMDIDDIRRIEQETGQIGKYDYAIQQMQNYVDTLDPNDFINK